MQKFGLSNQQSFGVVGIRFGPNKLVSLLRLLHSRTELPNAAFVVMQNLNPGTNSNDQHLTAECPHWPAEVAIDQSPLAPKHALTIPNGAASQLTNGRLTLTAIEITAPQVSALEISTNHLFLGSLASEYGDCCGVVSESSTRDADQKTILMQGLGAVSSSGGNGVRWRITKPTSWRRQSSEISNRNGWDHRDEPGIRIGYVSSPLRKNPRP
jgi:hypothetical protein